MTLRRWRALLRERIARAMTAAAAEAAHEARILAPVRTGRLRDSIGCSPAVWEGETAVSQAYAAAPYALYAELGAAAQPPRPFLRPAGLKAMKGFRIER